MRAWRAVVLAAAMSVSRAAMAAEPALARVGGVPITATDLRAAFELRHEGHVRLLADETVVRDFLESMVEQSLFVLEARRLELDRGKDFEAFRRRELRRLGVRWLYETEVRRKVRVKSGEVRRAVSQMGEGWEVIRIRVNTREEAEAARGRLLAGEDPAQVAREVSMAPSRLRGGLELVRWGYETPEVEARLWGAAPGELTDPLPTPDGWVVFRVIARHPVPLPEQARAKAREVLRSRAADRLRSRFLERLRRRYGARIREERLDLALLERHLREDVPDEDPVLATFEGGELRLSELVAGIDAQAFDSLPPALRRQRAAQWLSDRLDALLLEREAERRWPTLPRSERAKLRAAEEAWLYRKLLGEVVFAGLQVTEQEMHDWYEAHREELKEPARVLLSVALLPDEAAARAFLEALAAGSDFVQLARERSMDAETALKGGRTLWITREALRPEIPDEVFQAPAGTVGGPVELDGGWLVYRVEDRRDARFKTEKEAAGEVRKRLVQQKRGEQLRAWAQTLRQATTVEYFPRRIARAVGRLGGRAAPDTESMDAQAHREARAAGGAP